MSSFASPTKLPHIGPLVCRQLTPADADAIIDVQTEMLAQLPDSTWYYPSDRQMFADCCERGESFGFFDGDTLAGFGTLTPWFVRGDRCYAAKIGAPAEHTFDFQDVMVRPAYRRRGLHAALSSLFEQITRAEGGVAMYCTISPDNMPSVASFGKAGFVCVTVQPAYEGMLRGYYRKVIV